MDIGERERKCKMYNNKRPEEQNNSPLVVVRGWMDFFFSFI